LKCKVCRKRLVLHGEFQNFSGRKRDTSLREGRHQFPFKTAKKKKEFQCSREDKGGPEGRRGMTL